MSARTISPDEFASMFRRATRRSKVKYSGAYPTPLEASHHTLNQEPSFQELLPVGRRFIMEASFLKEGTG